MNHQMQFRQPILKSPLRYPYSYGIQTGNSYNNYNNYTMIFIVFIVVSCIIVVIVVCLSLNSYENGNSGKPAITPAPKYDHCDSRLNGGKCPKILNNINGNMCFANFDANTGSYVVKNARGNVVWDNKINNPDLSPYTLNIESNGNLCVKDSKGKIQWETKTTGVAPFLLKMQDDCNLVLYDSYINKLWETSTTGKNN